MLIPIVAASLLGSSCNGDTAATVPVAATQTVLAGTTTDPSPDPVDATAERVQCARVRDVNQSGFVGLNTPASRLHQFQLSFVEALNQLWPGEPCASPFGLPTYSLLTCAEYEQDIYLQVCGEEPNGGVNPRYPGLTVALRTLDEKTVLDDGWIDAAALVASFAVTKDPNDAAKLLGWRTWAGSKCGAVLTGLEVAVSRRAATAVLAYRAC